MLGDIVNELEQVIESATIEAKIVAPLSHFSMEIETLPLGDFVIRRLEDEEATRLFGNRPDLFGTYTFGPPRFAIVGSVPFPKVLGDLSSRDGEPMSRVRGDIQAILVALRVLKSGPVGCREILLDPASGPLAWAAWHSDSIQTSRSATIRSSLTKRHNSLRRGRRFGGRTKPCSSLGIGSRMPLYVAMRATDSSTALRVSKRSSCMENMRAR